MANTMGVRGHFLTLFFKLSLSLPGFLGSNE